MSYPIFAPSSTWYSQGGTTVAKTTFTGITILDSYTPTGEESENWNADVNNNGDIKCYIKGTELIIAGNGSGKLALNEDSSYMFSNEPGNTGFTKVEYINGLDILDTSNTITMSHIFSYCYKLKDISINNFDTSHCTDFSGMFVLCEKLTQIIGIDKIDTSNVTSFGSMFQSCEYISELDLTNFDTKKGTNMFNMFERMIRLKKITLGSNFNFSGNGTTNLIATLPIPRNDYITGTDGRWHSEDCITYAGANIPNETKMTYYAVPSEVPTTMTIKYGTLYDIANAIRIKTSNDGLMDPVDMTSKISLIPRYKMYYPDMDVVIGNDGYITLMSDDFDGFTANGVLYMVLSYNGVFYIACREASNNDNFYYTFIDSSSTPIFSSMVNMCPNDPDTFKWLIDPNLLDVGKSMHIEIVCMRV